MSPPAEVEPRGSTGRHGLAATVVANDLVVAMELWALPTAAINTGPSVFTYYTDCSNLFAGIVCTALLVAQLRQLLGGRAVCRGLVIAKYLATCCLLMTFFVVVLVLVPWISAAGMPGRQLMFADGTKPVTHLAAPLVVFASYVLWEGGRGPCTLRDSVIGVAPTLLYAT